MKKLGILFIIVVLLNTAVSGQELTIEVTGYVTSVENGSGLPDLIEVGALMSGSCSYDLDSPDLFPGADYDYYGKYELNTMKMCINAYVFNNGSSTPTLRIGVGDETYLAKCLDGQALYGGQILSGILADIVLFDLCNASISRENDLIPTSMPDIDFFYYRNEFSVEFEGITISGVLDSIEVIPEPCSVVLLGLGSIALLRRRRLG